MHKLCASAVTIYVEVGCLRAASLFEIVESEFDKREGPRGAFAQSQCSITVEGYHSSTCIFVAWKTVNGKFWGQNCDAPLSCDFYPMLEVVCCVAQDPMKNEENFIPALRKKVKNPNYEVSLWEWAREPCDFFCNQRAHFFLVPLQGWYRSNDTLHRFIFLQ